MIESWLEEAMTSLVLKQQAKLMTALPCRITQVHDGLRKGKIDVQPVVNTLYRDGSAEERPQILEVPLVFPSSKTSSFSFPVNVGDIVLCVFSSRNIDGFKAGDGTSSTPEDNRRMSQRDAMAIPGLFPFGSNVNNPGARKWPHDTRDMVMAHNLGSATEVEIRMTPTGKVIINTEFEGLEINAKTATVTVSDSMSLNGPQLNVNMDQTNWSGNITLSGNITQAGNYTQTGNYSITGVARFNGIVFETHFHSGVMSGPSNSGPVAG